MTKIVITRSGELFGVYADEDIHHILTDISKAGKHAGEGYDHPNILIENGVIVVPELLYIMADVFAEEKEKLNAELKKTAQVLVYKRERV